MALFEHFPYTKVQTVKSSVISLITLLFIAAASYPYVKFHFDNPIKELAKECRSVEDIQDKLRDLFGIVKFSLAPKLVLR